MIVRRPVYLPSENGQSTQESTATTCKVTDRQRDHWRKLHTQTFDASTFETWVSSIPGCAACQRDFRKLLETNPPRFDEWFAWTVEIHNLVNAKLGKPIMSFEEANQLHRDTVSKSPDQ